MPCTPSNNNDVDSRNSEGGPRLVGHLDMKACRESQTVVVERWMKKAGRGACAGITLLLMIHTERSKNLGCRDISLVLLQERDMNVTLTLVG